MMLKRLHISIILLSCIIGAVLTYLFMFSVARFNNKSVTELFYSKERYDVEIMFLRINKSNRSDVAVFQITNSGTETLSYTGYNKQENCGNYVIYEDKIAYGDYCSCGTVLQTQNLKSGEKTTFTSNIPKTKSSFVVGYDFFVKSDRYRKTYWSDIVEK